MFGTAQLVGATDSWMALALDEVSQDADGRIVADQAVRLINPSGEQVGVARLPLSSFDVSVAEPVTVTPGGDLIALIPRSKRVDVVKLPVVDELDPVLPSALKTSVALGAEDLSVGIESCVDRAVMRNTDVGYRTNSKYLSDTNINGACTYRTKPRYLGSAGTYGSVSYRWGGFDTVSNFNSHMSPATGKAGDITSGTEATCAYGVDCSGFVSRVWQLGYHCTTSCLDDSSVSHSVSYGSLLEYDIFDKPGSHVILFRYYSGNGYYVSESTTASSYDRVIYRWISSSTVGSGSGYSPYRYDNVCG